MYAAGLAMLVLLFAFALTLVMLALFVGSILAIVKVARMFVRDERPAPAKAPAADGTPVAVGSTAVRSTDSAAAADGPTVRDEGALATWRYRQLVELDLDPVTAAEASLAGVDAASVRSLTERGCPAGLAVAILEPDEPA